MIYLAVLFLLSGVLCYCLALTNGLGTKRWGVLGLLLGPCAFAFFSVHYQRAFRRQFCPTWVCVRV